MKKLVSILCAGAMLLSLAACGAKADTTYAGQTVTGKVTTLEGTSVTLALGKLTENAALGSDSQQPPEMPGDGQTGDQSTGTPPEKPDGDSSQSNDSQPPEMPEGSMGGSSFTESGETLTIDITDAAIVKNGETVSATELSVDDVVQVTFDGSGSAATVEIVSGGKSGGFGGSSQVTQGSSANTISESGTYTDVTYTSTGDDENALRVDGATVTLDGITVDKSAGATSNTENGDFYGVNAALLATNGANVTITNATVTSSAQNGNGVFSCGTGTTVNISESMITTTADNSGGIQTTGGGTTNATNLVVSTSGNSSAAIRSDRGGGTVNVDGGSYVSNGYNSPAVYSTADITVKNAFLTANNSEALVIEGKNAITLENCTVTGNMSDTKGSSFTGTVNIVDNAQGGTAVSNNAVVTIESGCTWTLTGDCVITSLTNSGTINFNGYTITLADGTVLR